MNVKTREQAEANIAAAAANLSDEALCIAWIATEGKPVTQEVAIVRGWLMDELNVRLGDDLFDEWLMGGDENGDILNPMPFFERASR